MSDDREKLVQEALEYIRSTGQEELYFRHANIPAVIGDLTMRVLSHRRWHWTDRSLPDGKSIEKLIGEAVKKAAQKG